MSDSLVSGATPADLWFVDVTILMAIYIPQGCARFADFLQNFSERQILCSVVFRALTLKLPIQTSLSVTPELPVSLNSAENCHELRKTSTPQFIGW